MTHADIDAPQILACVPVDRSCLPQIPELDAIVITDLYTLRRCMHCSRDVWVGPRQTEFWRQNLEALILCFICAMISRIAAGESRPEVHQLGGGYPAEGRPRVVGDS